MQSRINLDFVAHGVVNLIKCLVYSCMAAINKFLSTIVHAIFWAWYKNLSYWLYDICVYIIIRISDIMLFLNGFLWRGRVKFIWCLCGDCLNIVELYNNSCVISAISLTQMSYRTLKIPVQPSHSNVIDHLHLSSLLFWHMCCFTPDTHVVWTLWNPPPRVPDLLHFWFVVWFCPLITDKWFSLPIVWGSLETAGGNPVYASFVNSLSWFIVV